MKKIILANSVVVRCSRCGTWLGRYPAFFGDIEDKDDSCYRCGCTSVTKRDGRPFGPKSNKWGDIVEQWEEWGEDFINDAPWLKDSVKLCEEEAQDE